MSRDPQNHLRLALWSERNRPPKPRTNQASGGVATLIDPKNATARGLAYGLVAYRGHWEHPEAVNASVSSDEDLTAKLAEYNARRDRMESTRLMPTGSWPFGAKAAGLKPEARAHLATVTRLDPSREAAWTRLGFKKHGGRHGSPKLLDVAEERGRCAKKAVNGYSFS